MSENPPHPHGLRHRVKALFRRSDTEATTTTATAHPNLNTESLQFNSTAAQAADTDVAQTSSSDLGQVPSHTNSLVDGPTIVASKTPFWDLAVSEFRDKRKAEYEELKLPAGKLEYEEIGLSENGIEFENSILNKKLPEVFQEEAGHSNHAIMRRLKSWLPALGAAKALSMTLARLDPNQLAPYIVAGSFFAAEILLQTVPADQKEATLDVICDSVIIMLKWRSYEENISPSHRSISDEAAANAVQLLNRNLPELYTTALKLQARIRADTRSRKRFTVAALLGSVEAWKAHLAVLKREDRDCVAVKDIIKDCLDRQDHHSKVLEWIKKEGAPDPRHKEIRDRTGMDQDSYRHAGRWFLESEIFKKWMTPGTGQSTERVVWLKGTMGTGKSTLMCQAISRFSEEEDRRPPGNLRVAYYYCSASATRAIVTSPDKESVLRSLCRKLAWQPTQTIAKCASDFHAEFSKKDAESPDWGDLLHRLLDNLATPIILVIDALDECSKEEELLRYLADSVQYRTNLYVLCSSRPHVQVAAYFHAAPAEIDTMSGKREPDMSVFIATTIEERKRSPETQESIFRQPHGTTLLDDLKRALERGAYGMFRWVEIWLSILFPPNPQSQIFESDDVRSLIDQIENSESSYLDDSHAKFTVAYKQLWKVNSRPRHKVLQPRMFHIVLCAFDDLTLDQLTEALRIDPEGKKPYQTELQPKHVEWLCYNFLVTTSTNRLEWAHQSAKDFVTCHMMKGDTPIFSEASNHIYMSQIALQLVNQIHHPAWKNAGLDLPYWRGYRISKRQTAALKLEVEKMAKQIHEATEKARSEHGPGRTKDQRFGSESFVHKAMLDSLCSSELMKTLAPVFEAASFASYVAARFLYHLRVVCDTTASMSGLEQLMKIAIASPDSALPAVARFVLLFNSVREPLKNKGMEAQGDEDSWFAKHFSIYSQLACPLRIARRRRTCCTIMKAVCTDHDGKILVAPLQLLTLINTPDKALIQYAVTVSRSTLKAVDWNSYPADLMFLACNYNSDKILSLFLNRALFPASRYQSFPKLLQALDEDGRLPIHVAALNGYYRVIEELVRAEDHDASTSSTESHVTGGDEPASDDDHAPLLYVPDEDGELPIHLAAQWNRARDGEPTFDLMIRYDAKYATLFPATLSHQPGVPESTRKQTSMLLTQNHLGYLPIHLVASKGNVPGVQAMLQREFEAYCEYVLIQSPQRSSRDHQQRSQLLFARSQHRELPIDIALYQGTWLASPERGWMTVQTMLEFEAKWMDLTPKETPSLKLRSELLNGVNFSKMVWHWKRGYFKSEWLGWVLDRYEVHSSVAITTYLTEIRGRMETVTAAHGREDKLALLQKKDDYLMRLLEQLPFGPGF